MAKLQYDKTGRLLFTKEMKKEYTMLFPMMAPIHFNIIKEDVYMRQGLRLEGVEYYLFTAYDVTEIYRISQNQMRFIRCILSTSRCV